MALRRVLSTFSLTHLRVLGSLALLSRETGQNQSHKQTTAGSGASGLGGLLCTKKFPSHPWSLGLKMEERICECVWDCGVRSWGGRGVVE